ncbi:MAG: hemerythrin domain-containing protein [Paucibacter sp.]|nr:hemerythrin domain-containing protein [Roseateles sp.]
MNAALKAASRPAREPITLVDRFAVLDLTHQQVFQHLSALRQLADRLAVHDIDAPARATAQAAFDFFETHARQHHAEEEQKIFPGLLNGGDEALRQHVLRLQQDHGWLEQDWSELGPMLDSLARGYSSVDPDLLREALAVFTALYTEHVSLEELLIYPEAKRKAAVEEAAKKARLAGQAG